MSLFFSLFRHFSFTRKCKADEKNTAGKKKGTKLDRCKLRAKCMAKFAEMAGIGEYVTTTSNDTTTVEFNSEKSLDELREIAGCAVGLHALKQTMQEDTGKCTGKRHFKLVC